MNIKKYLKPNVLILILIVLTYFLISYLLIRQRFPLWYDELYTLEIAKADISKAFMLMIGDGKPPLYYILVKLYSLFVGTNSDILLRLSSTILGVPFIVYVYKIAKEFIKNSLVIPFIITILLAFNPLFLSYSVEYRGYTMLASATLIYLYYFYKSVIEKNEKYNSKFLISKILLLLTSYLGIFLLVSESIYKVLSLKKEFSLKKTIIDNRTNILVLGITGVIVLLQTNIFPNFNAKWLGAINITSVFNSFMILLLGTDPGLQGSAKPFNVSFSENNYLVVSICFYILIVLVVYLLSKLVKSNVKELFKIMFINFIILLLLSLDISPTRFYLERYVLGVLLSLCLIFFLSVSEVSKKIFIFLSIVILFINSFFIFNTLIGINNFIEPGKYSKEYIDYYYNYLYPKCGINIFERNRIKCPPFDEFDLEKKPIYK